MHRSVPLLSAMLVTSTVGCGNRDEASSSGTPSGSTAASSSASSSSTGSPSGAGGDDGGLPSGGAGGSTEAGVIYANSATTLYRIDPISKQVAVVGDFSGDDPFPWTGNMSDLAVNSQGELYGSTLQDAIVRIDPTNAHCTVLHGYSEAFGLTFVPKGVLDPMEEVLVASSAPFPTTSPPANGDVVSIQGGGTFVNSGGNDGQEHLYSMDLKNKGAQTDLGGLGQGVHVGGLAYWGGELYAFTSAGELYEVDTKSLALNKVQLVGAPAGLSFSGAAVTTIAPIAPPK